MEWLTAIPFILIVLWFIGFIVESHLYHKNRPPSEPVTEEDLLNCLRELKHGQEPDPFERELIKGAIETQARQLRNKRD